MKKFQLHFNSSNKLSNCTQIFQTVSWIEWNRWFDLFNLSFYSNQFNFQIKIAIEMLTSASSKYLKSGEMHWIKLSSLFEEHLRYMVCLYVKICVHFDDRILKCLRKFLEMFLLQSSKGKKKFFSRFFFSLFHKFLKKFQMITVKTSFIYLNDL